MNHLGERRLPQMSTRFGACRDEEEEGNIANDSCGRSEVRGKLVKLRFLLKRTLSPMLPSDSLVTQGFIIGAD